MDERGHVNFRGAIPDGPVDHGWHAAADGQLGGIMKVFRDWQISGDSGWLKKMYPLAKRSLDYCIGTWDPDHRGGLFEPHHNTYDIEFWGADGMCTSIYLGALSAMLRNGESRWATVDAGVLSGSWRSGVRGLWKSSCSMASITSRKCSTWSLRDTSFAESVAHVDDTQQRDAATAEARRPEISVWKRMPLRRRHRSMDGATSTELKSRLRRKSPHDPAGHLQT